MTTEQKHKVEIMPGSILLNITTNGAALKGLKTIINSWFNNDDDECDCGNDTCDECQGDMLARQMDIAISKELDMRSRFLQKLRKKCLSDDDDGL